MAEGHKTVLALALAAIFAVLYFRAFEWMAGSWLTNPFYAHGFLIPPVSVVLGWMATRKMSWQGASGRENLEGLVLLVPGLLVYLAGMLVEASFVVALSLPVVVLGVAYYLYGRGIARALLFPAVILLLMVPLPFIDPAATWLAAFSASCATVAVNVAGIPAINTGAEVLLEGSTLVVGVPCSGMSSIISLLVPALVLLYIVEGPLSKKALVLALFIPVTVGANVLRIAALLAIAVKLGEPLALGFFHTFYGLAMPVIAFVALIIVSRCLGCLKLRSI